MASTIRHNRARGTHSIELMVDIVAELTKAGMSDEWIKRILAWMPTNFTTQTDIRPNGTLC